MATSAISSAAASSGMNGINLDSFLKIVLAQLTYQDPLKPVDSAQFVSQLAQMTSLEQSRQLTDKVDSLLSVQAATQVISLLGKQVEVATDTGSAVGNVTSVTFQNGTPQFSITSGTAVLPNITADKIILVRNP
jgi:flagellar basal-body rod modification protein FlgD